MFPTLSKKNRNDKVIITQTCFTLELVRELLLGLIEGRLLEDLEIFFVKWLITSLGLRLAPD